MLELGPRRARAVASKLRKGFPMFQEKIAQHYTRLGRNQKKIADFLTQKYHEAAFINAFALSQRLEVDPATVTRFAQRLGYAGYPELLREIQEMVKKELRVAHKPPVSQDDEEAVFLTALAEEKENLERAITHMRGDTVTALVSALREAEKIYVVAHGLARGPAQTFVAELQGLLGMAAQLVPSEQLPATVGLSAAGERDVAFGVSLAALHDDTAQLLTLARSRGTKTIGLCTSHTSPTASSADLILVCPGESLTGIPSTASLSAVLSALVQTLAQQEPQRFQAMKDGMLRNVNWLQEKRGEKRIQEGETLRQL
jgi:DNA-binding MurR/RpiR family transcriptional regulator